MKRHEAMQRAAIGELDVALAVVDAARELLRSHACFQSESTPVHEAIVNYDAFRSRTAVASTVQR